MLHKHTLAVWVLWSLVSCIPAFAESPPPSPPPFAMRVIYAPGHFGNSYEVMGTNEMRDYLAECKEWGFNRYADWFDTVDCSDSFDDAFNQQLGSVLWARKKANFLSAQALELPCDLVITPNHVFANQCLPDIAAVRSERIFGQLVCPSKPQGREVILRNYDRLFADLARSGVRLNALWAGPYDYGGCACDACKPWIVTFAKLSHDIFDLAAKYHPGIEMRFIGWWWSEEEHRLFAEWADREAPGWVKSLALHIPYDATDVGNVVLPKGCERQAFVHIGYGEELRSADIYGQLGPVVAVDRLERTVSELKSHGCTGVMAYSEGMFDDVNKAILAGLASGKYASGDAILAAYATRYFHANDSIAPEWKAWLKPWGHQLVVDAATSATTFAKLAAQVPEKSWRLQQWALKIELLRAHNSIMQINEWTPERMKRVDDFWAVKEELERRIWGIGLSIGCMSRTSTDLAWYAGWVKQKKDAAIPVKPK